MLVIIVSLQCEFWNQSFCFNFFAVLQACEMHYFYYVAFGFQIFLKEIQVRLLFPIYFLIPFRSFNHFYFS